jgi:alpha-L-fucosidase
VKTPEKLFDIYLTSVGRGSTLLLNIPPDQRGLLHENDLKSLQGFKQLLETEFGKNLALNAKATSSAHRGNIDDYSPSKVTDGDAETYWATNDDITTGSVEIDLADAKTIKYIQIQEYITLGQRVKSFTIEAFDGANWSKIGDGTTIGYKRIVKINPVETSKIRFNVTAAKACPLISSIEVF